jgi:hypothetical protein
VQRRATLAFVSLLGSLGCQRPAGALELGGPAPVEVTACRATPPATKLRRLTRLEWQASVKRALGVDATLDVPDDEGLGFSTVSEAQAASVSLSAKLLEAAEAASGALSLPMVSPCDPSDACAPAFVATVGRALFRRPVSDAERARLSAAYQTFRATNDVDESFRLLTQVLLQSPAFLFRDETTEADGRLDGPSLAVRLAFALTGEGPDDALLDAAATGALSTSDGVRHQAERLLGTAAARRQVGRFHVEWLGVAGLGQSERGAPDGGFGALRASMEAEVAALGAWATLDGPGLDGLLAGKTTFVDGPLAAHYGFSGIDGPEVRQVRLDQLQRMGVLTAPGVLAAWAKQTGTSPTKRGRFVRERLLCETLPTPPPNVSMTLPPVTAGTTRQRFAQHVADPACAGCHLLVDPIGFGLERYDETGAFRLVENGRPIDAHGEVVLADGGLRFEGAEPLARWVAGRDEVRACVARQWFRFTLGRAEAAGDSCTLDAMTAALGRGDVRAALLELVTSEGFRLKGGAP